MQTASESGRAGECGRVEDREREDWGPVSASDLSAGTTANKSLVNRPRVSYIFDTRFFQLLYPTH